MRIITSPLHHLTLLGNILLALLFLTFSVYLLFDPLRGQPVFTSVIGLLSMLTLFLPRLIAFWTRRRNLLSQNNVAILEIITSSLTAANALGALGFYLQFQYYDMVLHVIGPWGIAVIASMFFRLAAATRHQKIDARLITLKSVLITLALSFLWEAWEFAGDRLFGTYMLGQTNEQRDTFYDIIADILAMIPFYYYNQRYLQRSLS